MVPNKRICVVGAGPSGVAAAKNCILFGLDVVVFEKGDKVGGNWVFNVKTGHSSVYENTHIISSKVWSEYEDFPMPDEYPDYPSHRQLQAYFESYARTFGVYERIRFNHVVQKIMRLPAGDWRVEYQDAEGTDHVEQFNVLMIANGQEMNSPRAAAPRQCPWRRLRLSRRPRPWPFAAFRGWLVFCRPTRKQQRLPQV